MRDALRSDSCSWAGSMSSPLRRVATRSRSWSATKSLMAFQPLASATSFSALSICWCCGSHTKRATSGSPWAPPV
ncbi:hypothetical protein G6F57_021540 [Rhizopus arrhizus]|nr:hypothetical protein G6F40_015779 [Rhizopus arrhizus]KAG1434542.1 hypothetical protein G6F57_021540 [Rhizopus arrhizus]